MGISVEELIRDACLAEEIFGLDALEDFAEELRKSEPYQKPPMKEKVIAKIDVELEVEVPPDFDLAEMCDVTFSIPIEGIVMHDGDGKAVPGARVVGYTTGEYLHPSSCAGDPSALGRAGWGGVA